MVVPHKGENRSIFGILLCSSLAILALALDKVDGLTFFSPLLLAITIGILARNAIGINPVFYPGIRFCLKRILKLAIILLGFRLSFSDVEVVGINGLAVIAISLVCTFGFTLWLGKQLTIERKLVLLLAAGTTICGASAVVAANSIVESSEEDVVYAVSLVTVIGTLATFLYPILLLFLPLSPQAFGIWCGVSIQDVAQVIAAAFQNGNISGEFATISKLSRVLFLVPTMLVLSFSCPAEMKKQKLPLPWMVLAFLLVVILNSYLVFPPSIKALILQAVPVLLTISLAALGLQTDLRKVRKIGYKGAYLAGVSWLLLSLVSLGLIKAFGF